MKTTVFILPSLVWVWLTTVVIVLVVTRNHPFIHSVSISEGLTMFLGLR